jgi:hypothetical protein
MEDENEENGGSGCVGFIVIVVVIYCIFKLFSSSSSNSNNYSGSSSTSYDEDQEENTISKDDAISDHWDEIKSYLSGTTEVEACYDYSNCYSLEAEISDGSIEKINFNNGGYLYFNAEIDSNGEASDYDDESRSWTFTLDMSSSIVDDAINEWADSDRYIVE